MGTLLAGHLPHRGPGRPSRVCKAWACPGGLRSCWGHQPHSRSARAPAPESLRCSRRDQAPPSSGLWALRKPLAGPARAWASQQTRASSRPRAVSARGPRSSLPSANARSQARGSCASRPPGTQPHRWCPRQPPTGRSGHGGRGAAGQTQTGAGLRLGGPSRRTRAWRTGRPPGCVSISRGDARAQSGPRPGPGGSPCSPQAAAHAARGQRACPQP